MVSELGNNLSASLVCEYSNNIGNTIFEYLGMPPIRVKFPIASPLAVFIPIENASL